MRRKTTDDSELAETVEALKDDFRRFREDIASLVTDLGHAGKEGVASAGRHIRNGTRHTAEEISARLNRAKDYGSEKLSDLKDNVKSHPFMTALIALGVGAFAGRFFRR
ncbi:MAG: hypothetical protein WD768_06770 [Phycisphaeraceae bacterium]